VLTAFPLQLARIIKSPGGGSKFGKKRGYTKGHEDEPRKKRFKRKLSRKPADHGGAGPSKPRSGKSKGGAGAKPKSGGGQRGNKQRNSRQGKGDKPKKTKSGGAKPGEAACDVIVEPPASFGDMLTRGLLEPEAVRLTEQAGLTLPMALSLSVFPAGGRIRRCPAAWGLVTKDHWVLGVVRGGFKIPFLSLPPTPMNSRNPPTDPEGMAVLDTEVEAMQTKAVIRRVDGNTDGVVSPFFARPKAEAGKWRPILSMKQVNLFIRYTKFRMVTIKDIRLWIRPDYFLSSLDLTDAYFSIPLCRTAWRFVRFVWRDLTYEFMTNMFGLGPSARLFTKVLAVVIRFLRKKFSMLIQGYIDDFLIQAMTATLCTRHTHVAIIIFHCLGFEVNMKKSSLVPAQSIAHLGFEWDSAAMLVTLPDKKVAGLRLWAANILDNGGCTAGQLRSFVGTAESTRPAVELAALHYRSLQALLPPVGAGENRFLSLTERAQEDLRWWRDALPRHKSSPLRRGPFTLTLSTDASGEWGWGGFSSRGYHQGKWEGEETTWHINRKELEAARRCLLPTIETGDYALVRMDSTAAVAYVNKHGGTRSSTLSNVALDFWKSVSDKGAWMRAAWVPREENQTADLLSKENLLRWEFGLLPEVTKALWDRWGTPAVDCFASSTFHSLPRYFSLASDPMAEDGDAFSVERWPETVYAFPPLPLVPLTLERIKTDAVTAILVVPDWTACKWWDGLQELLVAAPLQLGRPQSLLRPLPGARLPYLGRSLVACLVRGPRSRC
jgi:hypothetical protein